LWIAPTAGRRHDELRHGARAEILCGDEPYVRELEQPGPDERPIRVDVARPRENIVAESLRDLDMPQPRCRST
jgi:hypothetical protein